MIQRWLSLLALCAAFLWAPASLAQLPLTGVGSGSPVTGATGFVGDIVSGATAYYGVRAYNAAEAAAATQAMMTIHRTSDGSTCSVAIATTGGPGLVSACSGSGNGQTVAVFCNATTCLVNSLVDQSGNAASSLTTAGTGFPTLVLSCSNGNPCIQFSGAHIIGISGFSAAPAQPFTMSAVGQTSASSTTDQWLISANTTGRLGFNANATTTNEGLYCGTGWIGVTASVGTSWHSMSGVCNGASSAVNFDGTETTTGNPGTTNCCSGMAVGGNRTVADELTGDIGEVVIWPSGLTATQRKQICQTQKAWWSTAATC